MIWQSGASSHHPLSSQTEIVPRMAVQYPGLGIWTELPRTGPPAREGHPSGCRRLHPRVEKPCPSGRLVASQADFWGGRKLWAGVGPPARPGLGPGLTAVAGMPWVGVREHGHRLTRAAQRSPGAGAHAAKLPLIGPRLPAVTQTYHFAPPDLVNEQEKTRIPSQ